MPRKKKEYSSPKPSENFASKLQSSFRDLDLIRKLETFEKNDDGSNGERVKWDYEINNLLDNPHLIYNRLFVSDDEYNGKKEDNKKKFLTKFISQYETAKSKINYESIYRRYLSILNNYNALDYNVVKNLNLQTDWRLIVGLGGESILETSICLHPLYGFPYIPGSAVKGVAKAASILLNEKLSQLLLSLVEKCLEYSELHKIDEIDIDKIKCALSYKFESKTKQPTDTEVEIIKESKDVLLLIRKIFGNQSQVGSVIFFDAIPYEKLPELELDIMNNHYTNYYEKGTIPGDWISPNPVFFVNVKPQQKFSFFLASKDDSLLKSAEGFLKSGLEELGAGGKTSAGYGYFIPINNSVVESVKEAKSSLKSSQNFKEAEIIDDKSKPPKVKIIETGEVVNLGGVNLKGLGLTNGFKIFIEPIYAKKSKKIQSVQYKGKVI
jgi:CRISPR-associated protein Cmr6